MNTAALNAVSVMTNGNGALQSARMNKETSDFASLLERIQGEKRSTVASSQILEKGRLNGDFTTGFSGTYKSASDKNAPVQGAATNQAGAHSSRRTIDKTSTLYEKSMELESYFVKQVLSSMRKTVSKSGLGGNDFASQMYEDMLYDEYAASMTKNAGFGLADQIYLSLAE